MKLPVALPLALSVMFWGVSWRYWLVGHDGRRDNAALPATLALIVAVPVISVLAYNVDMGFAETWYRYTISYYAAIALFILFTTKVRITNPVMVRLGLISYSVYLLGPLAQIVVETILPYESLAGWPIHLVILLTMLLVIAAAALSYRFVELPFQRVGKRLADRPVAAIEPA